MIDQVDTTLCPICNRPNNCGKVDKTKGDLCWCAYETFPPEIFKQVTDDKINKTCICKNCLNQFKKENPPE